MPIVPIITDNHFIDEAREKALRYAQTHYSGWATLADREDLVQDALMTMYKKVHEGSLTELTCSLSTLVIGFLKNIAKKKQRELPPVASAIPTEHNEEDVLEPIDIAIVQQSIKRWQDDDNYGQQMQMAIYEIVNDLQDPCKTILWAYYWDGKSTRVIAEEQNYSTARVAITQLSRCRTKVKTAMEEICKQLRS